MLLIDDYIILKRVYTYDIFMTENVHITKKELVDFQGFSTKNYAHIFSGTMPRLEAETNFNFKHAIVYAIIRVNGKILFYTRTPKGNEDRLHNNWSCGFGGHVNSTHSNFIDAIKQELEEELNLNNIFPKLLGYINDDSNEVGKVHIGALYLVDVDNVSIGEDKISNLTLCDIDEAVEKIKKENVESWSKIAISALLLFT